MSGKKATITIIDDNTHVNAKIAEEVWETYKYETERKNMDIIRVLRVIEYIGPRDQVEEQVKHSIQGERRIGGIIIHAATVSNYPEMIENVKPCFLSPGQPEPEEESTAELEAERYERLENEHLGDWQKGTGIYASRTVTVTNPDLLWTEDDCTRNTEGHEDERMAWRRLGLGDFPEYSDAKIVDHGDCMEYQFPNGISLWNIHGAYHEIRRTKS